MKLHDGLLSPKWLQSLRAGQHLGGSERQESWNGSQKKTSQGVIYSSKATAVVLQPVK